MGEEDEAAARFRVIRRMDCLKVAVLGAEGTSPADRLSQFFFRGLPCHGFFFQGRYLPYCETLGVYQPFHDLGSAAGQLFLDAILKKDAVGTAYVFLKICFRHEGGYREKGDGPGPRARTQTTCVF